VLVVEHSNESIVYQHSPGASGITDHASEPYTDLDDGFIDIDEILRPELMNLLTNRISSMNTLGF